METQLPTDQISEPTEGITIKPAAESEGFPIESGNQSAAAEAGRQVAETATNILADLPAYVTRFFQQYRSLLVALGWLFAALLSLKLLGAILGTINAILFGQSFFELIGLATTAWFINRYLLTHSKRQELSQRIDQIKQQILGGVGA